MRLRIFREFDYFELLEDRHMRRLGVEFDPYSLLPAAFLLECPGQRVLDYRLYFFRRDLSLTFDLPQGDEKFRIHGFVLTSGNYSGITDFNRNVCVFPQDGPKKQQKTRLT